MPYRVGNSIELSPGAGFDDNDRFVLPDGVDLRGGDIKNVGDIESLDEEVARRDELYDSATQLYVAKNGDDVENDGRSRRNAFASIQRAVGEVNAIRGDELGLGSQSEPVSISVESGEYHVDNPITVPPVCSITGTDLRTVQLYPQNPKLDFFHCDSLQYYEGLRFYNHKSPAFCFSFPRVIAEPTIENGFLVDVEVLYSPEGYLEGRNDADPIPLVDPPRNGTQAEVNAIVEDGVITDVEVVDEGSGYETKPVVSIPAPEDKQPFVIGSPYPVNCSSITGPFDVNGEKIPDSASLPYDTENPEIFDPLQGEVREFAEVDEEGAGGGIIIDGRLCLGRNGMTDDGDIPPTPLNSIVTAQFTQVNEGGPGHLVINDGFAQFVSSFTTFCTYSFKCKTGGLGLISNSVSDLGKEGLVAEGRTLEPYTTGQISETKSSKVAAIKVDGGGRNYTDPTVTIDPPENGTQAQAEVVVDDDGEIVQVAITDSGSGYESEPDFTLEGEGTGANLRLEMNLVGTVSVENLDNISRPGGITRTRTPEVNSVIKLGDEEPVVSTWEELESGNYQVTFSPGVFSVDEGDDVEMYSLSTLNTGAHIFEYPGTGVTYNALPEYGGVPDYNKMINEYGVGKVYHTSSDQQGNFYVGDQFQVNQQTGEVTLNTDQFNLSGLNSVGPFEVDGVSRGVQLQEVTDRRDDLISNSGLDGNAVPTVGAVREWVQDITDTKIENKVEEHRSTEVHSEPQPPQEHSNDAHAVDFMQLNDFINHDHTGDNGEPASLEPDQLLVPEVETRDDISEPGIYYVISDNQLTYQSKSS